MTPLARLLHRRRSRYRRRQEYHGVSQIRAWREKTNEQYQFTLDVTDIAEGGNETIVTTLVSGNFDGSPVQLHFHFTLTGDKIAALSIRD